MSHSSASAPPPPLAPALADSKTTTATAATTAASSSSSSSAAAAAENTATATSLPSPMLRLRLSAAALFSLLFLQRTVARDASNRLASHLSVTLSGAIAASTANRPAMGFLLLTLAPLLPSAIHRVLYTVHLVAEGARQAIAPNHERAPYRYSLAEAPQRPLELAAWALACIFAVELIAPPSRLSTSARGTLTMAKSLCVQASLLWTVLNLLRKFELRYGTSDSQRQAATSVMGLQGEKAFTGTNSQSASLEQARVNALAKTASLAAWFGGLLSALSTIGVNIRAVLTFSGVGGVLIGLAGREMIANFIGGVIIYLSQPFTVGDWIHNTERTLDGWVEEIGWYYVKVNTWEKRPMYVPNSLFYSMSIINASRMTNRRILQTLRLRLQDMSKVPAVVSELRETLLANEALDPRQHRLVFFRDVGEYSVDIWLSCFTRSVFLADYLAAQQDILCEVDRILAKHGARLASATNREQVLLPPDEPQPDSYGTRTNLWPGLPAMDTSVIDSTDAAAAAAAAAHAVAAAHAPDHPLTPPDGFKSAAEIDEATAPREGSASEGVLNELADPPSGPVPPSLQPPPSVSPLSADAAPEAESPAPPVAHAADATQPAPVPPTSPDLTASLESIRELLRQEVGALGESLRDELLAVSQQGAPVPDVPDGEGVSVGETVLAAIEQVREERMAQELYLEEVAIEEAAELARAVEETEGEDLDDDEKVVYIEEFERTMMGD